MASWGGIPRGPSKCTNAKQLPTSFALDPPNGAPITIGQGSGANGKITNIPDGIRVTLPRQLVEHNFLSRDFYVSHASSAQKFPYLADYLAHSLATKIFALISTYDCYRRSLFGAASIRTFLHRALILPPAALVQFEWFLHESEDTTQTETE
jgi:hypothetical protein